MNETNTYPNLIWLDLEMTGLDPDSERIIEIATVVTNADLDDCIEGPNLTINQPMRYLHEMDDWNTEHHSESGLLDSVKVSKITEKEAESQTLDFLRKHSKEGTSPLCGNSISHDRRFLLRYMPELASFFHYRNIDVSSIKELVKRWKPELIEGYLKENSHRALADIYESIDELKFYKKNFLIKE